MHSFVELDMDWIGYGSKSCLRSWIGLDWIGWANSWIWLDFKNGPMRNSEPRGSGGRKSPLKIQGLSPEAEAVCWHCLQILTAETIRVWKCPHTWGPLILHQSVSRSGCQATFLQRVLRPPRPRQSSSLAVYVWISQFFRQSNVLTLSKPVTPNGYTSKRPGPYWSNPPFLIFDIRALWRSLLSARAPECQNIKNGGLDQ